MQRLSMAWSIIVMAWSIIIMTDLVCEDVLSVPTHTTGRHTKRVATIRKSTLHMCCKNRRSNTCMLNCFYLLTELPLPDTTWAQRNSNQKVQVHVLVKQPMQTLLPILLCSCQQCNGNQPPFRKRTVLTPDPTSQKVSQLWIFSQRSFNFFQVVISYMAA